jgi:hypothetical protein
MPPSGINLLVLIATFKDKFCSNLQGILTMVKIECHFFVFFLKQIQMKIFAFNEFQDLFNNAHLLSLKVDQIFTRLSLEHKELGSVEISRLSLMVPET